MQFDHLDPGQGELPPEYGPRFQGGARVMTHLAVQVPAPGGIDWDVEEGDWALDY